MYKEVHKNDAKVDVELVTQTGVPSKSTELICI